MSGFLFMAFFKVLEWSLVAAAVLTYIEIGYGGEALGALVESIKTVLMDIEWSSLMSDIWGHFKDLVTELIEQSENTTGGNDE